MKENFSFPGVEQPKEVYSGKQVQEKEESILEKFRGKAREIGAILTLVTAFTAFSAIKSEAADYEQPSSDVETEQDQGDTLKLQREVQKAFVEIQQNITDPGLKKLAMNFLQSFYFEASSTEDAAKGVVEMSGMQTPEDFENLLEDRKLTLEGRIKVLSDKVSEKGNNFNDDGAYYIESTSSFSDEELLESHKELEELHWAKKLGVLDNPELKQKFIQSYLEKSTGDFFDDDDFFNEKNF